MTWNPSEWGGVQRTRINQHKIWTPDIYLQEDINADMAIGEMLLSLRIILSDSYVIGSV